MDPFTITAIIGIGASLLSANQAEKDRKAAERDAEENEARARKIREDTRFEEEPSILSVGASRTNTPSNGLKQFQIGL